MARDILTIQASNVASDIAFSQARLQIGDYRASMKESLEKSVLFSDWISSERRNSGLAESQPEVDETCEEILTELENLMFHNSVVNTVKNGNPSATFAATTIGSSSRTAVPPAKQSRKFFGVNFKGWQQRVFFWLTTLGMQKFTSQDPPVPAADMPDNEKFMIVEAWKHANFLCKGYILSALEDDLYNVYGAMNTSKELWDALEKKYNTEDACLKEFVVAKFLDYKMIGNKTIGTHVQEIQLIFHDLIA
ncbi:uncharacterized protein [Nicotiana tomentosiformis]|uniref:uncharacterized protein n=1 Tax=Nicotiana tomentosiformis TaxID=4098 RepID=UPI00388CBBE0